MPAGWQLDWALAVRTAGGADAIVGAMKHRESTTTFQTKIAALPAWPGCQ